MLNQSSPALLAVRGDYANIRKLKIKNLLPFAFPYGMGGPKCSRRTRVSEEACLQRYLRLGMRQFMTVNVCLIIGQMNGRILYFRSQ